MTGKMTVIRTDGTRVVYHYTKGPPRFEEIQGAVLGYLETVPYFTQFEGASCVAFCNEEGKLHDLDLNEAATADWHQQLDGIVSDVLVGPVAILQGDAAFMAAI